MSSPRDQWEARLAQTGGVDSRRVFDDLSSADSAVAMAKSEAAAGRMAILSFKVPGNDWAGVGRGTYDAQLKSLTNKLDGVPGQVFVTLHHEPYGDGSAADYSAMMRRALPILGAPSNVDAGPIVNGFWWSKGAQGKTDAEIAQWLPTDVLRVSEVVAADTYQGGTAAKPGENAGVKIRRMSAWADRVGVQRLGLGEYNGVDAASVTAAGDAILADRRFVFAAIFNSSVNNREGINWTLTGDRLTAFKQTVAKARTGAGLPPAPAPPAPAPPAPAPPAPAPPAPQCLTRGGSSAAADSPAVRRANVFWLRVSSSSAECVAFGTSTDIALMGDWDGNGTRTPGVLRGNTWFLRNDYEGGFAQIAFSFGRRGDLPVVGDWDGDGVDTIGVVRGNRWYLRDSNRSGPAQHALAYGVAGDQPIVGDWNGDGRDTPGVVRRNAWYLSNSLRGGNGDHALAYGTPSDVPVVGDWNGDAKDTPGVFRSGTWHLKNALEGGVADVSVGFGTRGDQVVSWR